LGGLSERCHHLSKNLRGLNDNISIEKKDNLRAREQEPDKKKKQKIQGIVHNYEEVKLVSFQKIQELS
jgi:hypothetical protein